MANEWIWSSGQACYNTAIPGFSLSENNILIVGNIYAIQFSIEGMTQGKLVLQGILDSDNLAYEFTEDGDYSVVGTAISNNLIFTGEEYLGLTFDGCINNVAPRTAPKYQIQDTEGNPVFTQTDITQTTGSGVNIQYSINWEDIEPGCYKIILEDSGLTYESDCLSMDVSHDCTILLDWTNNDNAFGFNFSDLEFNPKLRVKAKKWHPKYTKTKTLFKDSVGNRTMLKSDTDKEEFLTVREQPEYIHDALAIGLEHDEFQVDGVKYSNEETEYTPAWRKSSQLAPVEIVIIKDQDLQNNNCG